VRAAQKQDVARESKRPRLNLALADGGLKYLGPLRFVEMNEVGDKIDGIHMRLKSKFFALRLFLRHGCSFARSNRSSSGTL